MRYYARSLQYISQYASTATADEIKHTRASTAVLIGYSDVKEFRPTVRKRLYIKNIYLFRKIIFL